MIKLPIIIIAPIIPNNPNFKTYYDFLGTKVCKNLDYKEADIRRRMNVALYEDKLRQRLMSEFPLKSKFTKKYIKQKLSDIYKELNLGKNPKASDLSEFFDMKEIMISNKLTNKRDMGFEIIGIKTI